MKTLSMKTKAVRQQQGSTYCTLRGCSVFTENSISGCRHEHIFATPEAAEAWFGRLEDRSAVGRDAHLTCHGPTACPERIRFIEGRPGL